MLPAVTATPGHTTASLPTIAASPPTVDTERAIASFIYMCMCVHCRRSQQYQAPLPPAHLVWRILPNSVPAPHLSPFAWHTITSYCEGIRFFLKSCISIVLLLFPIYVQRILQGFQSHPHLNIIFYVSTLKPTFDTKKKKKSTAKKLSCLTILYSLNNHKQFLRKVLQAQF